MSGQDFSGLLEELEAVARAAGAAEIEFQKEVAKHAAELREERAFAWRRLNLLRAVAAAVAAAKDEDEAGAAGRKAFYGQVGWNGATQNQRDVAERFAPVVAAVWTATRPEGPKDAAEVKDALATFEAWYAETRSAPFLSLMERDIVELPLVEV